MAELAIILGSGFSKPAGLPLANDITNFFLRDNKEEILHFSSDEFYWYEYANDADKNNGRIHGDYLAFGILLNTLVEIYIEGVDEFNYEEFYQFVIDKIKEAEFIDKLKSKSLKEYDNAFPEINKDVKFYDKYVRKINKPQKREIKSLINHLIADLLYIRITKEEIEKQYSVFVDFLKKFTSIDFITTNHDTLLEYLIDSFAMKPFADGFTKDHNVLKTLGGEPIKMYQGVFDKELNIIKLHGSVDTFRYEIAEEKGSFVNLSGEYLYFKTNDYNTKQFPYRYDPDTGKKVQSFHWAIDPNFITGTKKEDIISKPGMYNTLYKESESRLLNCKTLLIIGYSFGDDHVNQLIKIALEKSEVLKTIINVNPSVSLPFKNKEVEIKEHSNIDELTKLNNEEHQL